jgi:neutral trehalase
MWDLIIDGLEARYQWDYLNGWANLQYVTVSEYKLPSLMGWTVGVYSSFMNLIENE